MIMEGLKSEFSKGDVVHYMNNNKPTSSKIVGISYYTGNCESSRSSCNTKDGEVIIILHTSSYSDVEEIDAFESAELLKESLFGEEENSN